MNNPKRRVVVEVENGEIVAAYTDIGNLQIEVADWDAEPGGEDALIVLEHFPLKYAPRLTTSLVQSPAWDESSEKEKEAETEFSTGDEVAAGGDGTIIETDNPTIDPTSSNGHVPTSLVK